MKIKKRINDETGSVAVLVALLLVVLLGFSSLVVDMGCAYVLKNKVQQTCDAAALGAAIALPDICRAETLARYYVDENGLDGDNAVIEFLDSNNKIKVSYKGTMSNKFATIWGKETTVVTCDASATREEAEAASGTFDYAIFSGSDTVPLSLSNGNYYVEGKVHSNNELNVNTHTSATSYTSVKGGDIDIWNAKIISEDSEGNWSSKQANPEPTKSDRVDMPTYLGDRMWELVENNLPTMPASSYWEYIATGDLGSWATTGSEFKAAMEAGKRIMMSNITGSYMNYAWNTKADIYINSASSISFQPSTGSVLNGDVYIYNKSGMQTKLYFPWGSNSVINGNIYCMSGDLNLGNVTVNGNVYCAGKLSTDGGKTTINCTYVYANSIQTANDTEINGAVIAENDIAMYGGQNTANVDSVLTVYSKNGNITFGTANSDIHGIIFAPKGSINCVASVTVYGSIIGNEVKLTTGNVTVKPPVRDMPIDTTDPNPKKEPSNKVKLVR